VSEFFFSYCIENQKKETGDFQVYFLLIPMTTIAPMRPRAINGRETGDCVVGAGVGCSAVMVT
jgi:hypothetical protein